jgi:hypothetical protein
MPEQPDHSARSSHQTDRLCVCVMQAGVRFSVKFTRRKHAKFPSTAVEQGVYSTIPSFAVANGAHVNPLLKIAMLHS